MAFPSSFPILNFLFLAFFSDPSHKSNGHALPYFLIFVYKFYKGAKKMNFFPEINWALLTFAIMNQF